MDVPAALPYEERPALELARPATNPTNLNYFFNRTEFPFADDDPSKHEKFCLCRDLENCKCGENDEARDWLFDEESMTSSCELAKNNTEIIFHPRFSVGTACVRADRPLQYGYQHYFEVKILTRCFGTDIMIGIGTGEFNMGRSERRFASLLGDCKDSWGFSYKGYIYHNSEMGLFHDGFGAGTIIGVHVDLFRGRLMYHINRKLVGVAYTNLNNPSVDYYPMFCSTAAKSRIRLIAARSYKTNLQYLCCDAIRQTVPSGERYLSGLTLPPNLKLYLENNINWVLIGTAPRPRIGLATDNTAGRSPVLTSWLRRDENNRDWAQRFHALGVLQEQIHGFRGRLIRNLDELNFQRRELERAIIDQPFGGESPQDPGTRGGLPVLTDGSDSSDDEIDDRANRLRERRTVDNRSDENATGEFRIFGDPANDVSADVDVFGGRFGNNDPLGLEDPIEDDDESGLDFGVDPRDPLGLYPPVNIYDARTLEGQLSEDDEFEEPQVKRMRE